MTLTELLESVRRMAKRKDFLQFPELKRGIAIPVHYN